MMRLRPKQGARAPRWIPLIALLGMAGAPTARAQGVHAALLPFEQTVAPGDTFNIDLNVTQAGSPFNGWETVVSYDPGALTILPRSPVSAQQGCLMVGTCGSPPACGNTFHHFTADVDSLVITDVLLCDQFSLTGPGQIYRLHFGASTTPQVTHVRVRRAVFYNAGLYVTPVTTADCAVGIGVQLAVEDAGAAATGLRVRAEPNPSPGAVVLTVEASAAGEQALEVIDVQGRVVRRLASGWFERGLRRVAWDGRDASGARAPAGVYLVKLRAGKRGTQTHVTLLK